MASSTTVGVKLDKPMRERLRKLGAARDRAPHWLIKSAIAEYLDREESAERERIEDEQRWARYQDSGHFVEHAKAMAWLDKLARGKRAPCPR